MHKFFCHSYTIYHENNKANLKPDCFNIFENSLLVKKKGALPITTWSYKPCCTVHR